MVRNWTIKKAIDWAFQYLERRRIENPHLNAELLVSYVLAKTRLKLYLEREHLVSPWELSLFKELLFSGLIIFLLLILQKNKILWVLSSK